MMYGLAMSVTVFTKSAGLSAKTSKVRKFDCVRQMSSKKYQDIQAIGTVLQNKLLSSKKIQSVQQTEKRVCEGCNDSINFSLLDGLTIEFI